MAEMTEIAAVSDQRPNPDKSFITAIFLVIVFLPFSCCVKIIVLIIQIFIVA